MQGACLAHGWPGFNPPVPPCPPRLILKCKGRSKRWGPLNMGEKNPYNPPTTIRWTGPERKYKGLSSCEISMWEAEIQSPALPDMIQFPPIPHFHPPKREHINHGKVAKIMHYYALRKIVGVGKALHVAIATYYLGLLPGTTDGLPSIARSAQSREPGTAPRSIKYGPNPPNSQKFLLWKIKVCFFLGQVLELSPFKQSNTIKATKSKTLFTLLSQLHNSSLLPQLFNIKNLIPQIQKGLNWHLTEKNHK